jgi:hypothetical protein
MSPIRPTPLTRLGSKRRVRCDLQPNSCAAESLVRFGRGDMLFTAMKLSGLTDMESIPQRTRNSASSG